MKKVIFALLAVLISNNAAAEWTRIAGGDDGSDIYVDLDTVRKNGSKVKFWTLQNFKTLDVDKKSKHFSSKTQWEVDCNEEKISVPVFITYSGKKGTGKTIISDYSPDGWRPLVPDTIGEMIFFVGCDATIGTHKWVLLTQTKQVVKDNLARNVYFDYASARKVGDQVSMWQLIDYIAKDHAPKNKSYSVKLHREYDCIEQQGGKTISYASFRANMGVGESERVDTTDMPWKVVEGAEKEAWKSACDVAQS